jgi:hypothetical protein
MAYVSQEKKARIVAAAKAILPKDWKVTFRVEHHSSITATIRRCPATVQDDYIGERGSLHWNKFHPGSFWKGKTLKVLQGLQAALDTDNFDHSDSQTDYFHVGHYTDINFGEWNKPCEFVGKRRRAAKPVLVAA